MGCVLPGRAGKPKYGRENRRNGGTAVDTLEPRDDPRQYGREGEYERDATFAPAPGSPGMEQRSYFDAWNYRPDAGTSTDHDIVGYHVETVDGRLGKIDEHSHALDASYLVVDTGPWIFGKKVMLPAGVVTHIDHADNKVYVECTKEQVKASPEFDADLYTEPTYRDKLGAYYSDTYSGGTGAASDPNRF
jgi:hypothetical protein